MKNEINLKPVTVKKTRPMINSESSVTYSVIIIVVVVIILIISAVTGARPPWGCKRARGPPGASCER